MTRSEAAKICQSIKFILENSDYTEAVEEALNMAIEALEQEPTAEYSSDVISRQAAIDAIEPTLKSILQGNSFKAVNVMDKIRDLPSAQPFTEEQIQTMQEIEAAQVEKAYELGKADRPTGHWIEHDDERVLCECSECHEKYLLYEEHVLGRNFCPNCGARMESDINGSD